jgi:hypothetical protein
MVFTFNKVPFCRYYAEIMSKRTWNASFWVDRSFELFHKLDFGFLMCNRVCGFTNCEVIVILAFWFFRFLKIQKLLLLEDWTLINVRTWWLHGKA